MSKMSEQGYNHQDVMDMEKENDELKICEAAFVKTVNSQHARIKELEQALLDLLASRSD